MNPSVMKKNDTSCILIGSRSASHAYAATAKKKNEGVGHIGTKTGRDTILHGHRLQVTVEQAREGERAVMLCGNLSDLNQVTPLSSSQP